MRIRAAIVILSDKGFTGEREDKSGPTLKALLEGHAEVISVEILPDDRERISAELVRLCDAGETDVILTSGGTGLAPRDVTPQATADVIDYAVPGVAEAIRAHSMQYTGRAMLSRGTAGRTRAHAYRESAGQPQGCDRVHGGAPSGAPPRGGNPAR